MSNLQGTGFDTSEASSASFYTNKYRVRFVPDIETRYQRVTARKQKRYTRLLLTILIILYVLFGACDYYVLREEVLPIWAIRYFVGLPSLVLCYVLLKTRWVESFYQWFLVAALTLIIVTTYMMVYMVSGDAYHLYTTSILALVMGGLSLTRIGYVGAVFTGIVYVLMSLVIQYQLNGINSVAIFYLLLGIWAVVFCVVSSFSHERVSRNEFLQKILIQRKNTQLRHANERLKSLVDLDSLTGISNRRHFDHVLDHEWRRAMRRQYPLALLMVDIDYFKAYNDTLGHMQGDVCLRDVAQGLSEHARRPGDLVARYGGEEFSVILPALDLNEAEKAAEILCLKVQELGIAHPKSAIKDVVTVSIGVAVLIPNQDNERSDLIKLADDALYVAKKKGRNRVEVNRTTSDE